MNPKKHKTILDDIYKELDSNPDLVNDVLDFYWAGVRKAISSVLYPKINIENLGIFNLRPQVLDKTILKYERSLAKSNPVSFNQYAKYNSVKGRIEILERAKKLIDEEKERRKEIKTNRYGRTNTNMEEEGEDS